MRLITLTTAGLLAYATAAQAEDLPDYSTMIAEGGLSQTATTLSALPDPTPSDAFALGGVNFLRAIERSLQTRYAHGVNPEISAMLDIPLLRLPLLDNPAPVPFTPGVIETLLTDALADFDVALNTLDTIGDDDAVAVTIRTQDLWFDVDSDGIRSPQEDVFAILSGEVDPALLQDLAITVTFDTADAAWLSAYAHLLSGVSETILAFDPTEAIETISTGTAQLAAVRTDAPSGLYLFTAHDDLLADAIGIALRAIEGQPDATRTRAAHQHFLDMIADNKVFWARVATETDNQQEWIPNKSQISALPISFPPETGQRWRAVLSDAEALLSGDQLLPHWRLGKNAGINLAKLMQDPPVLDVVGIIQGHTISPFAERGKRIDSASFFAFQQLLGGDAPLFMVILN